MNESTKAGEKKDKGCRYQQVTTFTASWQPPMPLSFTDRQQHSPFSDCFAWLSVATEVPHPMATAAVCVHLFSLTQPRRWEGALLHQPCEWAPLGNPLRRITVLKKKKKRTEIILSGEKERCAASARAAADYYCSII